ncbi:hypothetical protein C8N26_2562 [Tenacibaculum lutimaris]|uniref:Uncharacterized protein n=1 Tax=Tenacibaculum lutimaris TaxID=285258 RepID=A0A420DYP3_9FLAO|nr:hypothetical protein [Tenacibaculum lutimaris]RKF02915.1 hypothetical protein C8N26_2562 [Tenacibaculum lutimaris]
MKNQILNLGKALKKSDQQQVNGGIPKLFECLTDEDCNLYPDSFSQCRNNICYYTN